MTELIHEGIVVTTDGEVARVRIVPGEMCSKGHTDCPFMPVPLRGRQTVDAKNHLHAQPNDRVVIRVEISQFSRGMVLMFIVPLIMIIGGYALGAFLADRLAIAHDVMAISGLAVGFLIAIILLARWSNRCTVTYAIRDIVHPKRHVRCVGCNEH